MSKRREEIKRLVQYSKGLGIRVFFRKASKHDAAAAYMTTDIKEITIYMHKRQSKTETILLMIHELGHTLDAIHTLKRQPDFKYNQASHNLIESSKKSDRKIVLDSEREGVKWWDTVILDCNIKLTKEKIEYQKDFDLWQYEFWYEYDRFPTRKETIIKRKELRHKYYG